MASTTTPLSSPAERYRELELYTQQQHQFIQLLVAERNRFLGAANNHMPFPFFMYDPRTHILMPRDLAIQTERDHAELEVKNHELEITNHKLKCKTKDLEKKTEECDKLREHWQAAIEELSELKSTPQAFTVDDPTMMSKWKQLKYNIKNLAIVHLNNVVALDRLTKKDDDALAAVSRLYRAFLTTEGQTHYLFQAFVWKFISDKLLDRPAAVWRKKYASSTETLLRAGQSECGAVVLRHTLLRLIIVTTAQSMEEYHAWRAQTGEILYKERKFDDAEAIKRQLTLSIRPFISEKDTFAVCQALEGIIDQARDIAVIFNRSRSDYQIKCTQQGQRFDDQTMEKLGQKHMERVGMSISPALLKFGNSKGEMYDDRIVLAKSLVYGFEADNQEYKEGGKRTSQQ
ncbi:hypothetical protein HD806DRAFT_522176 [Xylariaceae sp. AK1471]|nr:hypothetical protein HD806DRAFT_522176 [Xylariaceae sp. AK1471]